MKVAEGNRCALAVCSDTHISDPCRRYCVDGIWRDELEVEKFTDSNFWFPLLWKRLDELHPQADWIKMNKNSVEVISDGEVIETYTVYQIEIFPIENIKIKYAKSTCMALCEAIEALSSS